MEQDRLLNHLTAIKPETITTLIVRQLYDLFKRGILVPGEKLPSETNMAKQLGVNRLQLRETIKQLEFYGIFRSVPQSGTYLASLGKKTLDGLLASFLHRGNFSYAEISEVRTVLERKSVELATKNITAAEIKDLTEAHLIFKNSIAQGNRGLDEDIFFHLTLARFSHNNALESTLAQLYSEIYVQTMSIPTAPPERLSASIVEHERILESIRSGDVGEAVKNMDLHMVAVTQFYMEGRRSA